jgi:hypothetical protein
LKLSFLACFQVISNNLNMASLKELDAMVDGVNLKEVLLHRICEGCIKSKHQITSFPKDEATRAS